MFLIRESMLGQRGATSARELPGSRITMPAHAIETLIALGPSVIDLRHHAPEMIREQVARRERDRSAGVELDRGHHHGLAVSGQGEAVSKCVFCPATALPPVISQCSLT